jgi:hypothetical protein
VAIQYPPGAAGSDFLLPVNETVEIILAADHPGNGKRRARRYSAD